jgi:hypothetical protein
MSSRFRRLALALVALSCACSRTRTIADPVPDIPLAQQRTVQRSDFDPGWPFDVATGTLACAQGAVVFRAAGVTYAVNDAARSRFAPADPIRVFQSVPPSNPLPRIKQNERMQIFAESSSCERGAGGLPCKQRLRERAGLSDAELQQIDAEGVERRWPPLTRAFVSLDRIAAEGGRLCNR